MALDDLKQQGLLLPQKHWGHTPPVSWRGRLQLILCGALFVVSAGLIWFGRGGWPTFVPWTSRWAISWIWGWVDRWRAFPKSRTRERLPLMDDSKVRGADGVDPEIVP